jgi:hypothetical protein
VEQLVNRSRELGIDIHLGAEVTSINHCPSCFDVHARMDTGERAFQADLMVHGAGRVPEIDDMNLTEAGIAWEPQRGVKVNEYLQSVSNPAVYAAGDAAASVGPPLTPVATYEGNIVAENVLQGNHRRPNYEGIPSVVFTVPPLASVGLQEEAARERGLKFRLKQADTSGWYSSRRVAERFSGFKVLVDEVSGRISRRPSFRSRGRRDDQYLRSRHTQRPDRGRPQRHDFCLSDRWIGCGVHGLERRSPRRAGAISGGCIVEQLFCLSDGGCNVGDRVFGADRPQDVAKKGDLIHG